MSSFGFTIFEMKMENLPSSSVVTPKFVPFTITEADVSGCPSEKTLPVIIKSWALVVFKKIKTNKKNKRMQLFYTAKLI